MTSRFSTKYYIGEYKRNISIGKIKKKEEEEVEEEKEGEVVAVQVVSENTILRNTDF